MDGSKEHIETPAPGCTDASGYGDATDTLPVTGRKDGRRSVVLRIECAKDREARMSSCL